MGWRYRDGIHVPRDLNKAQEYFQRALKFNPGQSSARLALKELAFSLVDDPTP